MRLNEKLNRQQKELKKILNDIEAKKQKDIAIFGKPLSNKKGRV